MIKCGKGHVIVKGNTVTTLMELSVLSLSIYQCLKRVVGEQKAKDMILGAVNTGIQADNLPEGEPDNG